MVVSHAVVHRPDARVQQRQAADADARRRSVFGARLGAQAHRLPVQLLPAGRLHRRLPGIRADGHDARRALRAEHGARHRNHHLCAILWRCCKAIEPSRSKNHE